MMYLRSINFTQTLGGGIRPILPEHACSFNFFLSKHFLNNDPRVSTPLSLAVTKQDYSVSIGNASLYAQSITQELSV